MAEAPVVNETLTSWLMGLAGFLTLASLGLVFWKHLKGELLPKPLKPSEQYATREELEEMNKQLYIDLRKVEFDVRSIQRDMAKIPGEMAEMIKDEMRPLIRKTDVIAQQVAAIYVAQFHQMPPQLNLPITDKSNGGN